MTEISKLPQKSKVLSLKSKNVTFYAKNRIITIIFIFLQVYKKKI